MASLSMNAPAISRVGAALATVRLDDCQSVAGTVLSTGTAAAAKEAARAALEV
jgi:phosphoenolpyruvate-protein kinase (PTS system EI component)